MYQKVKIEQNINVREETVSSPGLFFTIKPSHEE